MKKQEIVVKKESNFVRVAVRVRPFNLREKKRNADCIVKINNNTTLLFNPNDPKEKPKKFTFDYSYWSHDGFKESNQVLVADPNHENGSKFADQNRIYQDIGKPVLKNALEGYNTAIFAYGQTGSGKSFSVVGYGKNKGILPRLCEDLFTTINHSKDNRDKTTYEIRFSMIEIYNEIVRDLCNPETLRLKKGLKIREHPLKGFYAEGLKSSLVTSQQEINRKINEGTTNRSIAVTNMNETSSRAHTIINIEIIQKTLNRHKEETTKSSQISLVDLAGSERLFSTNHEGHHLKEGVSINLSLSCLINCIHSLSEKSNGKNVLVPYRDSVLTKLLMNALGGNSKTVMIATISPADINYEETSSTLRYADRAKQIKTHAVVNENATNKLLKKLREENDLLKKMMENKMYDSSSYFNYKNDKTQLDTEEMKASIAENENQMNQMKPSCDKKIKNEQKNDFTKSGVSSYDYFSVGTEIELAKQTNPYLYNLNFDEQLTGRIVHIINNGINSLGKSSDCYIQLFGPGIHDYHANLIRKDNQIILEQFDENCQILLNGDFVKTKVNLNNKDRLLFGSTQLYVFCYSDQLNNNKTDFSEVTFEMAQEEIAFKAGFEIENKEDQSIETALLNKDLLEVLPAIELANAISQELNKNVRFEVLLVSTSFLGKLSNYNKSNFSSDLDLINSNQVQNERTEVYVKVYDLTNNLEFEWTKENFLNRLFEMKEMYQNYEQGYIVNDWDLPKEKDPFYEDHNQHRLIGISNLYLKPLAFLIESKEQLEILDYKGDEIGFLNVSVIPCDDNGKEYIENHDNFVDSPLELVGKSLCFNFKIDGCRGLSSRFTDIYVKYRFFLENNYFETQQISHTCNPDFNYVKTFKFNPVTRQLVNYLKDDYVVLIICGKQVIQQFLSSNSSYISSKLSNAKQISFEEELNEDDLLSKNSNKILALELMHTRKQAKNLQQRIDNIHILIDVAEQQNKKYIPVTLVKEILSTKKLELSKKMIIKKLNLKKNLTSCLSESSLNSFLELNKETLKYSSVQNQSHSSTCFLN